MEQVQDIAAKAAQLGRGQALRLPVTWPGGTLQLVLVVLTAAEQGEAQAAARASGELRCETLQRALLDPDTGRPFFGSVAELMAIATDAELDALLALYNARLRGLETFLGDEFEAIEEEVKKKGASRSSSTASCAPRRSRHTTGGRRTSSPTASCSTTARSSARRPSVRPSPTRTRAAA